jgi:4,5-DOPA dioxygenase extradiol
MARRATILYIPHGGGPLPLMGDPGHADLNRFLGGFAATIDKPDAIIVVSAHREEAERVSIIGGWCLRVYRNER